MLYLTFMHRIGRTGRAGKRGTSISLWERRDWRKAGELVSVKIINMIYGNNYLSAQVTIMEEAGQDVPSWLRGEADRFLKHQVQVSFVYLPY